MRQIAGIVGKENIIVKLHPRNMADTWTSHGFKTLGVTDVPWELVLLANDIEDKVFLTVSSTASLNGLTLMDKEVKAVLLYNMLNIGRSTHVKQAKFRKFMQKVTEKYNAEEMQVFVPDTLAMLQENIKYLTGE